MAQELMVRFNVFESAQAHEVLSRCAAATCGSKYREAKILDSWSFGIVFWEGCDDIKKVWFHNSTSIV